MSSPYDVYLNMEQDVLDLKLTHLFIIQQMAAKPVPQVRYQIMMNARKYLGEDALSTAKFYRILDKLEEQELVKFEEIDGQKLYIITQKGQKFATSIQELVVQPGANVMAYFEPQFEQISNFVFSNASNVMIIDFSSFVELPILEYIATKVDYLSIISNRERYEWIKREIPNLRHIEQRDGKLIEPNQTYDTIITMYPANSQHLSIYSEFSRLLRIDGSLYIYEADEINPQHYVLQILFDAYAPSMYRDRADHKDVIAKILDLSDWELLDTFSMNGLLIYKIGFQSS